MTWVEDIGAYIQANGIGTQAIDIYYQGFSQTPNCIALFVQAGQSDKYTLRKTQVLKRPELGVRVRNVDDTTAETKATNIYTLLNLISNQIIGSTRFKKIKAMSDPFFVSQDDNNRFIYSINFSLEIG